MEKQYNVCHCYIYSEICGSICFYTFISLTSKPFSLATTYLSHLCMYVPYSNQAEIKSLWGYFMKLAAIILLFCKIYINECWNICVRNFQALQMCICVLWHINNVNHIQSVLCICQPITVIFLSTYVHSFEIY